MFAEGVLKRLVGDGFVPTVLVCNPDKPVGRKHIITPPSTKRYVLEQGLDVKILQPKIKQELKTLQDQLDGCEFAIVAAYSKIIPKEVLDFFPRGVIGVHPSLLPKHRGPSPIQTTLLNGEKETGITLYLLDEETDHGKVFAQEKQLIDPHETYTSLEQKLARLGGDLLVKLLPSFLAGEIELKEQDHDKATFTKMIQTDDGFVDLEKDDPKEIDRKIRALHPDPGVYTIQDGKRIKLLKCKWEDETLVIIKITPEGKKPQESNIRISKK